jgi:Mrp family chromosome partitioning ATPase
VLVDANLRDPGVAANLAINATRGLSDVLTGTASIQDVQREWGDDRLHVVLSGPPVVNPGELVASPAMAQTIRTLERSYDIVLIDAPPLLPVADGVVLGALTSGVVLVARVGHTRVERLSRAIGLLHGVGARPVGAVLNALPRKRRNAGSWRRAGIPTNWRRHSPPPRLPDPPRPPVPPHDSNVILELGTVRGRAPVIRSIPEGPRIDPPPSAANGSAAAHDDNGTKTRE